MCWKKVLKMFILDFKEFKNKGLSLIDFKAKKWSWSIYWLDGVRAINELVLYKYFYITLTCSTSTISFIRIIAHPPNNTPLTFRIPKKKYTMRKVAHPSPKPTVFPPPTAPPDSDPTLLDSMKIWTSVRPSSRNKKAAKGVQSSTIGASACEERPARIRTESGRVRWDLGSMKWYLIFRN